MGACAILASSPDSALRCLGIHRRIHVNIIIAVASLIICHLRPLRCRLPHCQLSPAAPYKSSVDVFSHSETRPGGDLFPAQQKNAWLRGAKDKDWQECEKSSDELLAGSTVSGLGVYP